MRRRRLCTHRGIELGNGITTGHNTSQYRRARPLSAVEVVYWPPGHHQEAPREDWWITSGDANAALGAIEAFSLFNCLDSASRDRRHQRSADKGLCCSSRELVYVRKRERLSLRCRYHGASRSASRSKGTCQIEVLEHEVIFHRRKFLKSRTKHCRRRQQHQLKRNRE